MGYCWIFFMPVLILIQGALYLFLAIWGLVLRECDQAITHIAKQPFAYIMDLIYFYDNACGPPQIYTSATGLVTMNLTDSAEPTSNRNFIFLICYVILSTLWILTSIWCLLTCFCCGHRGVKLLSYGSWFAVVLAGCILDAVATGFNIYNMVNTTSASKTFEFLGIIPSDVVLEFVKNYDAYFLAPSLVMACISSRIVLIWLLNLSGISNSLSYVLLEGCLYLAFSIWGLIMRECDEAVTDFAMQPYSFTMGLLYLQDESCGDPNITYFAVNHPVTLKPDWAFAETLKLRTYAFLVIYTILSCFFIFLSFMSLRRLRITGYQKPQSLKVFFVWLITVMMACVVDVVATGLYGYDITQTKTPQAFLDYLGIETDELTFVFLNSYEGDFVVAPIIVTVVCCRGIILWLFNAIGGIACYIGILRLPELSFTHRPGIINVCHSGEALCNNNNNNIVVIQESHSADLTSTNQSQPSCTYPVIIVEKEL